MKLQALTLVALLAACTSTPIAPTVVPYTAETCVVMDSKLGAMGDPITKVYDGREIKFCCEPCVAEFESDPEFYLAKLDAE